MQTNPSFATLTAWANTINAAPATAYMTSLTVTFTVPSTLDQTSEAKAGIQQMLLSALQAYQPTNPAEVAYKQALLAL